MKKFVLFFVGLMITKTGGSIGPDVRVGISLSYIAMATKLGGKWLERNLSTFLHHIISGLLYAYTCPKNYSTFFKNL